jgi:hypothetical protein
MKKAPAEEFVLKAKSLTSDEADQLFSRMRGKLGRKLEGNKIVLIEALALQLEKEEEKLREWRERVIEIKARDKRIEKEA